MFNMYVDKDVCKGEKELGVGCLLSAMKFWLRLSRVLMKHISYLMFGFFIAIY